MTFEIDLEEKKRMKALGVDIGNGFAFVSLLITENKDPIRMIPMGDGLAGGIPTDAYITPPEGDPIVVFDLKVGKPQNLFKRDSKHVLKTVKKRLHEETIQLDGIEKPVFVEAVYAAIVRDVIILAHQELANKGMEPIYDLVITYPASYEKNIPLLNRMTESIENVSIDGNKLHVIARLPEPAAAAIDYLYYRQNIAPEDIRINTDSFRVLVYDLGHGTFDIALVEASSKGNPYVVLDQDGLPDVGGKNFDDLLFEEAVRMISREYGYELVGASERSRLMDLISKAKIDLSRTEEVEITILNREGDDLSIVITRDHYEEIINEKVIETLEKTQQMLDSAEAMGKRPDAIILSGGASRTPIIKTMVEEISGSIPVALFRTSEAVSYGAARYANSVILEQRTLQKIGYLEENDPKRLEGRVHFVLDKGVKLPAQSEEFVLNRSDGRRAIRLYYDIDKGFIPDEANPNSVDCEHLISIPFDIPTGVTCKFRFIVEEDKNITVKCYFSDGRVITKNTSDTVQALIQ